MGRMFYSEKDIGDIVSKRMMDRVEVSKMTAGDEFALVRVGDGEWNRYGFGNGEFTELVFGDASVKVVPDDGGVFTEVK